MTIKMTLTWQLDNVKQTILNDILIGSKHTKQYQFPYY